MELKNIGKQIKNVRKKKEWSQEDLARKADIPLSTIAKIEVGIIKNPSIEKIAKIASALGVSVDELLNIKQTKTYGSNKNL